MDIADYLDRRYRQALLVMIVGWLIGLSVFSFSWVNARSAVQSARERALEIWAKPQGSNPATLPEGVRLALLALIQSKQEQPRHKKNGAPIELSAEEIRLFVSSPQPPQADLVRKFVRVGKPPSTDNLGILGVPAPPRPASPPTIGVFNDSWRWLVETSPSDTRSEEPSYWWFVDPATGQRTYRDLSDLESKMEWENLSAGIAFIFSLPWLWCFLLIQLDEGSRGR